MPMLAKTHTFQFPQLEFCADTATDESGDVHAFTVGLADKCAEAGVQFLFNHLVTHLLTEGTGSAARI